MLHPLEIRTRRHYAATSRRQVRRQYVSVTRPYARPKIDDY